MCSKEQLYPKRMYLLLKNRPEQVDRAFTQAFSNLFKNEHTHTHTYTQLIVRLWKPIQNNSRHNSICRSKQSLLSIL